MDSNNLNSYLKSVDIPPGIFICTWDLGRRCNFDCTYCGDDTHDNFSPHASLEELKSTVEFMFLYTELLMTKRVDKSISINLTGGEPTVNPHFPELSQYLLERKKIQEQKTGAKVITALTTNGSYSKKNFQTIVDCFKSMTISYHCDSQPGMREKVTENIIMAHNSPVSLKVNVMFHNDDDYFQECVDLMEKLKQQGVKAVPRIINGFSYTEEQAQWFKDFWSTGQVKIIEGKKGAKIPSSDEKKSEEEKKKKDKFISGRHCCMKIPLTLTHKDGNVENKEYCGDTNFKDWYCSINWKFLHIDQQRDEILHHQTCKANWGKTRGPIGKLSNWKPVIDKLKSDLEQGTMEVIQCTLGKCFCGLCAAKSSSLESFKEMMSKHTKGIEFVPFK